GGVDIDAYAYDSGDVVYDAYLDKDGNIWFTTSQEGVYKYDGQVFTNYRMEDGLCGNEVSSIIEGADGAFWFGTDKGLCQFDGKEFTAIPLPYYPKESEWLDKYYPMINPEAVTKILQDKQGDFWVGSNCAGLYRYDGHVYESYLQEGGNLMPDSMHHNNISAIAEDRNGHIWVGSFSHGGISQFDGTDFVHHSLHDGVGDGMISSIHIDRQNRMWVGTRNGGIYQYDGRSFINIPDNEGEGKIAMAKFFQDSKGTLWMSSYARRGVYQFDGRAFTPFECMHSDQLVDVMCMAEDKDGHIWFGGRYGLLWRYDGEELSDFTQLKRGDNINNIGQ
ncbi:MAG: two-component regulator propeller domain-containing protein, partial [Bacteroidota bacterium]